MDSSTEVEQLGSPADANEPERTEVEWLLTSGVLGRSANIRHVLSYVCEETLKGRTEQITEKTIAIQALGRRQNFEPKIDTIVRVTVRMLRKRLAEVYSKEGAEHEVHVVLPLGSYAPSFLRFGAQFPAKHNEPSVEPEQVLSASAIPAEAAYSPHQKSHFTPAWILLIGLAAMLLLVLIFWRSRHRPQFTQVSATPLGLPPRQDALRAIIGAGRKAYLDHSGNLWVPGDFCTGGTTVISPPQKIQGTEDPALYLEGQRGITHCVFPINDGPHEIHFHFAETQDLMPARNLATLSVNAGPHIGVDVVDKAGGEGAATSVIVTNVGPEADGRIHVDFISEVSPLNAVEILPAPSARLLPVRIVAGPSSVVDGSRQVWSSDRYYSGGRYGTSVKSKDGDADLFASERIGQFRYTIPVLANGRYRIKLYFREPWFRDGTGGPGSRIFNVSCNGKTILENFDIAAEAGSGPIIKSFEHIPSSASGTLELSFTSVVNYPLVNAIEVVPEN